MDLVVSIEERNRAILPIVAVGVLLCNQDKRFGVQVLALGERGERRLLLLSIDWVRGTNHVGEIKMKLAAHPRLSVCASTGQRREGHPTAKYTCVKIYRPKN